jgi:predicted lipoprotein with Yx(FWY)xxD motif
MSHRSWTARTRTVALAVGMTVALGAYGIGATAAGAASKPKVTVAAATVPGVGSILVDANGHALYTFTDAEGAAVECTGGCLDAWPPLIVSGKVKVAKGVKSVSKDKATNHVTAAGLPLYLFAGDTAAKQANGDGINSFGGTWHVLKAKVKAASTEPTATTKASSGYSGY